MKKLHIILTIMICMSYRGDCTNYFVSSSLGNDNWTGRLATPNASRTDGPKNSLQALTNLVERTAIVGDSVWMRKGDQWTTTNGLVFSSAHGTTQHNKFVGAYGTGNLPVIFMDVPGNVITFRGFDDTPTSYFHMRDIEVNTRATTNRPTGIWVGESWYPNKPHHIILDGLHIKNCSNGMILYDRDIIVQNCLIMDNGNNNTGQGIFCSARNVILRNNVLDNNGSGSVFVHSMYISQTDSVLIEGNEIKNADDGLKLRTTNNLIVRNNIIHDTRIHTIHLGGDEGGGMRNAIIEGNIVYNAPQGLRIASESGNQTQLTENVIVRNNIFPAMVHISNNGPVKDLFIFNNLLHSTTDQPSLFLCQAIQPNNLQIRNNIFYKNNANSGHSLLLFQSTSGFSGISLSHNLYHFPEQSENIITIGNTNYKNLNSFRNHYPLQQNNGQHGDPLFMNPPQDFHLSANSILAIDQGANLSGIVDLDFDGGSRPQDGDGLGGAAWDIGPFEFCCVSSIAQDSKRDPEVWIAPNPVQDRLQVFHSGISIQKITIYNMLGKEMMSIDAKDEMTEINLSELPSGFYLLRHISTDKTIGGISFVK
ncbi:MAG: right-handed parallel beta-helix repeat-containing protein [Saprospiraceae bacterium]|nr:right-handed parallel beta-helix repeat-containing protein [Saprospiraceae bacterium]